MNRLLLATIALALAPAAFGQDARSWAESQNLEVVEVMPFQALEAAVVKATGATDPKAADERLVVLEKGQARFDVAHDTSRPFIVHAGGEQIVAVGTQFDVRWTQDRLSVVLVQGQVAVLPARDARVPVATDAGAIWMHSIT